MAKLKKQKKSNIKKTKKSPTKREDMFASQAMHERHREEVKHEISSVNLNLKALEKRMDSRFNEMESRFSKIDARFNKVDSRFNEMESRFSKIDTRFDKIDSYFAKISADMQTMHASTQRVLGLVEEQRAENKTIWDKQALTDDRLNRLENKI